MSRWTVYRLGVVVLCLYFGAPMTLRAGVADRIVAIVNEDIVTQSELVERLSPIYDQYRTVYQGQELSRKMAEARRDILGQMIEDRLILQKAREKGFSANLEDVDERIQEVRGKFDSDEAFRKAVEEQGLDVEDLRKKYADQGLILRLVGYEVRSHVVVTPREIQDYYATHLDEFTTPERVRARMILIKQPLVEEVSGEGSGVGGKEEANPRPEKLEEIQEMLGQALFEDVARMYTEGPNPDGGGDLGFIARGEMVEEIDHALFSMKVGEISEPVQTRMGIHFFKIDARQEESVKEFQEVRDRIENRIYQEKFARNFRAWVDELKEDAFISIK